MEVFHPRNTKLSSEFIYVDGRMNSDGKRYYGEMGYIPWTNSYINQVYYDKAKTPWRMVEYNFGPSRDYYGASNIHNLFKDKWDVMDPNDKLLRKSDFLIFNTLVTCGINAFTKELYMFPLPDLDAMDVFHTYISGNGGTEKGWKENVTRKSVEVKDWIMNPCFNSANKYFNENIKKSQIAVEQILNKDDKDVYISISPDSSWRGSYYGLGSEKFDWMDPVDIASNMAIFGTFNDSRAGITAHCTYNEKTNEITMRYRYYLIDFYDYTNLSPLQNQDAVGVARSFELYGYVDGVIKWEKQN